MMCVGQIVVFTRGEHDEFVVDRVVRVVKDFNVEAERLGFENAVDEEDRAHFGTDRVVSWKRMSRQLDIEFVDRLLAMGLIEVVDAPEVVKVHLARRWVGDSFYGGFRLGVEVESGS